MPPLDFFEDLFENPLMSEPKAYLVLSTCPRECAAQIAERLVREGLCACVNVLERVESFYIWEGKLNRDAESLLVIKTASDRLADLQAGILAHHPYQVPEVVAVEIAAGNPKYLDWVLEMTRPGGR